MNIDYQGIAIVLGALATVLSAGGGLILQIAIFIRQGHEIQANRDLHESVNGQTKELKAAIAKAGFDAGEKAGIASERANPQVAVNPHK